MRPGFSPLFSLGLLLGAAPGLYFLLAGTYMLVIVDGLGVEGRYLSGFGKIPSTAGFLGFFLIILGVAWTAAAVFTGAGRSMARLGLLVLDLVMFGFLVLVAVADKSAEACGLAVMVFAAMVGLLLGADSRTA